MLAESPLYQKWMAEIACSTTQASINRFLTARFGGVSDVVKAQIRGVSDTASLERAIEHAARCTDLDDFRNRLRSAP